MRRTFFPAAVAVAAIALLTALPVAADDHEKKLKSSGNPEFDAEMAEWMKYAQPGEHHQHMKQFAGSWKTETKFWPAPGAEPQVSSGTAVNELVLGGRFLNNSLTGSFMGQPFEGVGLSGYDNYQKKHTDVWMDTMGTLMMPSEGICSEGGKVLKMTGRYENPMTGQEETMKMVTRVISKNEFVWEMFDEGPDGKEFKTLEVKYTRR